jgi:uncharacterized protein (TIGR02453 family)
MSAPTFDLPPFPGFRDEGLAFLRELKKHNDREWFKPRKAVLDDELLWPMRCLLTQASAEAARLGIPLSADPNGAIFRIYRDIRFSKNKNPYKTHVGAVLTPGGDKKDPGGLYIHVEPGNSYVAAGFWHPDSPLLRRWRDHICGYPDVFVALMDQLVAGGLQPESDEKLKRGPRGYELPDDHPANEYLKWKSFYATRYVSDDTLKRTEFAQTVVEVMQVARPLLELGIDLSRGKARQGAR